MQQGTRHMRHRCRLSDGLYILEHRPEDRFICDRISQRGLSYKYDGKKSKARNVYPTPLCLIGGKSYCNSEKESHDVWRLHTSVRHKFSRGTTTPTYDRVQLTFSGSPS